MIRSVQMQTTSGGFLFQRRLFAQAQEFSTALPGLLFRKQTLNLLPRRIQMQSRVLDSYPSELNEQTPFGRLIARRNLAARDVAAERNEPIVEVRAPRKLVLSEFADVAFAVTTMLASIASAVWVLTALIG
jgi:hypothetical protein